jgi:hypothetical protein
MVSDEEASVLDQLVAQGIFKSAVQASGINKPRLNVHGTRLSNG